MHKDYSKRYNDLTKTMKDLGAQIPEIISNFNKLHKVTTAEGSLSTKTKELVALVIAITVHCDGCIYYHVHDALTAGASYDEVIETIGVAILMGGGSALVYGCDALEALNQFVVLEKK